MDLIRGLHNLRARHRGCVAAIGNFDGMHLGHQAVLAELKACASEHRLPPLVVVFEPQPREYFQGTAAPARLTRLREKLEMLRRFGVERVLCLRFDERLATLGAGEFVEQVLIGGIGARVVLVGADFRFGRGRQGDVALLTALGDRGGYAVRKAATFSVDGERVSSSRVRRALAAGDMAQARRLLGHHYSMTGRIVHGDKRGRQLGFPTLNIDLHRRQSAVHGIYAARVEGLAAAGIDGMAYVGSRPVVDGTKMLLEVHLFDFSGECYGRYVRVELIRKLRDDIRFSSLAALREQMNVDAAQARRVLAGAP